jgi:hypothetical protein
MAARARWTARLERRILAMPAGVRCYNIVTKIRREREWRRKGWMQDWSSDVVISRLR